MASIFTYDPEPPRVSSPWPTSLDAVLQDSSRSRNVPAHGKQISELTDSGITRLEAEPQDGPVEYKLHLLLRPRRNLSASTTVLRVSGSSLSKTREMQSSVVGTSSPTLAPTLQAPSNQSRQNRLQNLTTQLLWRLQQSSPHHSASKSGLVIPDLLGAAKEATSSPRARGRLLPGLEESRGALYEIGVSDDGAFVGLVRDELEESFLTLRTMAYSLGCKVEVLREVVVGRCQWMEEAKSSKGVTKTQKEDVLWVAEALITPNLDSHAQGAPLKTFDGPGRHQDFPNESIDSGIKSGNHSHQLRVSLTGNTTAGKSSLLGILATSTLDDGRGKVRKSLHKHLHEIASGVTSSLVTELIGYRDAADGERIEVVNYASDSVSQWTDIHDACENGRLVAVTDSAGHIKYRRTTVRGLLSCAPHWIMCCIAAVDEKLIPGESNKHGDDEAGLDDPHDASSTASKAHLELCLALGLPLVVVITKLDLASNSGLRKIVGEVLTCLKASSRQVAPMFANNLPADEQELQRLLAKDVQAVAKMFTSQTPNDVTTLVPIVLTSAVTGAGIRKLHALLRHLPILCKPRISEQKNICGSDLASGGLFHIDEVFATSDARSIALLDGSRAVDGHVVSGHLSRASIKLGDICFIGPFDTSTSVSAGTGGNGIHHTRSCPSLKQTTLETRSSRVSPKSTSESLTNRPSPAGDTDGHVETWRRVKVVSLRNLRLPVRRLDAGRTGTVGIVDEVRLQEVRNRMPAFVGRIRKGMVMIRDQAILDKEALPAYKRFVTVFPEKDTETIVPGSLMKIYVASIRASAKVLGVKKCPAACPADEAFALDEIGGSSNTVMSLGSGEVAAVRQQMEVTFQLQGSQEWLELGNQVLVMLERGDSGIVGLNGVVGKIIQLVS